MNLFLSLCVVAFLSIVIDFKKKSILSCINIAYSPVVSIFIQYLFPVFNL